MQKKNIYVAVCVGLALIAIVLVCFFNYYGTWDVVPKSYKKYFNLFGFGVAMSWVLVAVVILILKRPRETKVEKSSSSFLGKAVEWDDDDHYPDVLIP